MKVFVCVTVLLFSSLFRPVSATTYMTQQEFINSAFGDSMPSQKPQAKTLWLDKAVQKKITAILDHRYPKLRLRYWLQQATDKIQTVWFLDEIGKERPISFAVSVVNGRVELIRVLAFRESRGGEIQMRAFTDQFFQIGLNNEDALDKNIDGISGATMSVSAMKKITRIALMLHKEVTL